MRVVVAASALLGALGVAAPAGAETAQQCHTILNQYRAKAGLAKASSTSIPALAAAAGKHAAYRVNVDPGDSILLASLGLPDLGLFGPKVRVPRVDQHATLYGAWVLDRNQRNQVALHPVWGVEAATSDAGAGLTHLPMPGAGSNTAVDKHLTVHMRAPRSVPLGGAMNITVRVQSAVKGTLRPEPEANLFFEVRTSDGRGVQWKAATTNALGLARVSLVALEDLGSFRVWLYVDKPGRSAVLSVPVTVRRR